MNRKLFNIISYLFVGLLLVTAVSFAGTLTPPGSPSKTMKSLSDLYELINTGANTPTTDFTTPGAVSATMHSLGDTYDLLKTKITAIDATKILTGTSIFGVAGSAVAGADLSNMFNGTCIVGGACPGGNEFLGGIQSQGGIDDANYDTSGYLTQIPPVDRYETTWTVCSVNNNYCDTGDEGANAKDETTDLVWSYPLKDVGGVVFDTTPSIDLLTGCDVGNCAYWNTNTYYSWSNSGVNNNNRTVQQLCADHTGWSLPHQKQLMQAYIDGSYGNLEPQGFDRSYWSATTVSFSASSAFFVSLSTGITRNVGKNNTLNVRCVFSSIPDEV